MSSGSYLKVVFYDNTIQNEDCHTCKYRSRPFAATDEIFHSPLKNTQKLTNDDHQCVKIVYKIALEADHLDFFPGDTIGILPCNDEIIIDKLFIRLNMEQNAEKPCEILISEQTTKKNPVIPKHLPIKSSLKNIFLKHVDINSPPKKLFLKSLSRYAQDPEERTKLEQLCTPQGSQNYTRLITTSCRNLTRFLETFISVQPPIELLLENLPPLQPRPYSISSSPLLDNIEITFFILEKDDGSKGLCTGWLEKQILKKSEEKIGFYLRQKTSFRLPEDGDSWLILIATGTGIAPFRGFLQHRKIKGCQGHIWLIYGCRYKEKDFLYREEIEEWYKLGVVSKLSLAFSREDAKKNYVQDEIDRHGKDFNQWILEKKASIYICGDFKTVVKDVKSHIVKNFVNNADMDTSQAEDYLKNMENEGRLKIDTWI